jgi:uncharacterized membrane protein (DUF2068 family)
VVAPPEALLERQQSACHYDDVRASRGALPWIVAFKAFKTLTLITLGVTLLATRQKNPVDVLMRVALAIHLPLTSQIFERALGFATNLTVRKETALAVTAFGYAALMGTEGLGLFLRKSWSRWFTIGATSSLIPIEIYEILRELHAVRVLVLVANVAIVVYLIRRRELFER